MTSLYVGTTAPSSTTNPPLDITSQLGGSVNAPCPGNRLWFYCSTNTTTEVTTANFFTDGSQLGMKVGDVVLGVYTTSANSSTPYPYLGCIAAVSTSGATLGSATS